MDDGTYSTKDGEVRKNVGDLMAEDFGMVIIWASVWASGVRCTDLKPRKRRFVSVK